jgi:hypothetical protein
MVDTNYSLRLRNLSNDYYHGHIDFENYRAQRMKILEQLDRELNASTSMEPSSAQSDSTSLLMQTISFFNNNTDVDK